MRTIYVHIQEIPNVEILFSQTMKACADSEGGGAGGTGPPPPLKNHKNIGFPSNIDPTKLPGQHSFVGHYHISMAFRWRADVCPLLVAFRSSPCHQKKKKDACVGPPLTKLSGSAHGRTSLKGKNWPRTLKEKNWEPILSFNLSQFF